MQPEWKNDCAFKILTGKKPFGRPRCRWKDDIRMDLKEIGINMRNWFDSAQKGYTNYRVSLRTHTRTHAHTHTHIHTDTHTYTYIYIYIQVHTRAR